MFRDKEALKSASDDILFFLDQIAETDEMEEDMYNNIKEEISRRGLK